jgi:formylglycine-generating enzyme required for sulfatase activity
LIERFYREVRAAARLSHPNIVTAYDAGEQDGTHYLVMELVEGGDLAEVVRRHGALPVAQAVECIVQAAAGLEYAHQQNVVHRDLKPSNLILARPTVTNSPTGAQGSGVLTPRVKVLDMGLARIADDCSNPLAPTEAPQLTESGQLMGTIDFMSPEQAEDTRRADQRSDIYSLGCTLYWLLTGEAPYGVGATVNKLLAHRERAIPSLRAKRGDVPEYLDRVFQKMIAKRPADRQPSMAAVIAELQVVAGQVAAAESTPTLDGTQPAGASADKLSEFLQNLQRQTAPTTTRPTVAATVSGGAAASQVVARSVAPAAVRSTPATKRVAPRWRKPLPVALAAVTIVALLATVIVIIRNKDGKEVARLEVPEGSQIEISNPKSANAKGTDEGVHPTPADAPFDAKQARAFQEAWAKQLGTEVQVTNSVGMPMVLIPPGEFQMGSTDDEVETMFRRSVEGKTDAAYNLEARREERPRHPVRLTRPFRLSSTEVTIGQFRRFVDATNYVTQAETFGFGNSQLEKADVTIKPEYLKMNWRTPGYDVSDHSPVTQVTWNDAVVFCNWLSEQENLEPCYHRDGEGWELVAEPRGYRLPTEAEWEFACRAGTTTIFSFGDDESQYENFGWASRNSAGGAKAVGLKPANPFGLRDMHGNVWEWCGDTWDEKWYEKSPLENPFLSWGNSYRVSRGGNWISLPVYGRSAQRYRNTVLYRYYGFGFRPALSSVGAKPSGVK